MYLKKGEREKRKLKLRFESAECINRWHRCVPLESPEAIKICIFDYITFFFFSLSREIKKILRKFPYLSYFDMTGLI